MSKLRVSGNDILYEGTVVGHLTIPEGTTQHHNVTRDIETDLDFVVGSIKDEIEQQISDYQGEWGDEWSEDDKYQEAWNNAIDAVEIDWSELTL